MAFDAGRAGRFGDVGQGITVRRGMKSHETYLISSNKQNNRESTTNHLTSMDEPWDRFPKLLWQVLCLMREEIGGNDWHRGELGEVVLEG